MGQPDSGSDTTTSLRARHAWENATAKASQAAQGRTAVDTARSTPDLRAAALFWAARLASTRSEMVLGRLQAAA